MSSFYLAVTIIVISSLFLTALAAIIRIVRGPTILDRMIASDVLLTTLMLSIGADMALRGHTNGVPIMVSIGATAVLATIVVARYVKRRAALVTRQPSAKGTEHV
jgi:multicomponent Na+:H+ antiporter subunit F